MISLASAGVALDFDIAPNALGIINIMILVKPAQALACRPLLKCDLGKAAQLSAMQLVDALSA
jgi:hypothetical protein